MNDDRRNKAHARATKPTSGHFVRDQPALPGTTDAGGSQQNRQHLREYLSSTHMNLQHSSVEQLQQRATAHQTWKPVEKRMLDDTQQRLRDPNSSTFKVSAHMVHSERRLLADRARQQESRGTDGQAQLRNDVHTYTQTSSKQGSGAQYESMTDMLVHGKQGPLTREQSAMGAEVAVLGHKMGDKDYAADRVGATRPKVHGVTMHSTNSPHGLDLSQDPGTQERERQGLPIMMGTSGSSSDMVRSFTHTQQTLHAEDSSLTPMDASENRQALKDLAFNWMRRGAPMENVRSQLSDFQTQQGQTKVSVPSPTATQTHSYAEVAAGVDLTLDGNNATNMQRSTTQARQTMTETAKRMAQERPQIRSSAGAMARDGIFPTQPGQGNGPHRGTQERHYGKISKPRPKWKP